MGINYTANVSIFFLVIFDLCPASQISMLASQNSVVWTRTRILLVLKTYWNQKTNVLISVVYFFLILTLDFLHFFSFTNFNILFHSFSFRQSSHNALVAYLFFSLAWYPVLYYHNFYLFFCSFLISRSISILFLCISFSGSYFTPPPTFLFFF